MTIQIITVSNVRHVIFTGHNITMTAFKPMTC